MRRKNLKLFRIEQDLTQSEMAARIGYDRGAYNAIEGGKRNAAPLFWTKLQTAFDIPADQMWQLMEVEK